jgi:hypothetical protein
MSNLQRQQQQENVLPSNIKPYDTKLVKDVKGAVIQTTNERAPIVEKTFEKAQIIQHDERPRLETHTERVQVV